MSVVCAWCGGDIAGANHRHAGYCSASCRDLDRADYRRARRERRTKRRGDRIATSKRLTQAAD